MKWRFFTTLLFITSILNAQQVLRFYDYKWHPIEAKYAAYYSIMDKEDSLWTKNDYFVSNHKLQMQGHYTDTLCKVAEGTFYYFYPNGNLQKKASFIHGKKNGTSLSYYENNMMSDSLTYDHDKVVGISAGWYRDGTQKDSTNNINDSVTVDINWFDNAVPSSAGRYLYGKKTGPWVYYNKKGILTAKEQYKDDILLSKTYYSEDGKEIDTLKNKDRVATFPGGDNAWTEWLYKNLYTPVNVQLANTDKVVVVVSFEINEEGKLVNESVVTPFHDEYDSILIKVLRKSPKWKPSVAKNRNVTTVFSQAVFFKEVEN